jgi:hypothetical protein
VVAQCREKAIHVEDKIKIGIGFAVLAFDFAKDQKATQLLDISATRRHGQWQHSPCSPEADGRTRYDAPAGGGDFDRPPCLVADIDVDVAVVAADARVDFALLLHIGVGFQRIHARVYCLAARHGLVLLLELAPRVQREIPAGDFPGLAYAIGVDNVGPGRAIRGAKQVVPLGREREELIDLLLFFLFFLLVFVAIDISDYGEHCVYINIVVCLVLLIDHGVGSI